MGSLRAATLACLCALAMAVAGGVTSAQDLPPIPIESYPEVSREPIALALAEARAHPTDAARVGHLAMVLHAWEQFDTAAAVYARARALERRFEWYYLGGLVEARAARHAEAAALLAEAVSLRPDNVAARLALADARFESGDIEAAARDYSGLTSGASAPHAHYGLGRCLASTGDAAAALRELDEAVALFPEFGPAHYARGMALRRLGRTAEAQEALVRSQELGTRWPAVSDPVLAGVRALRDDPSTRLDRALALQKQNDTTGAIVQYEAALAVDPALAAAHVNLIGLYGRQQDWARAAAHYQALERTGRVPAEGHYNYGLCLAAQNDRAAAASQFEQALAVNPQHAGALTSLGQLAELSGRVDEAEAYYRKASAAAPQDPSVRFNVGRMLLAKRRYDDARAELEPLRTIDHPDRPKFLFGLATADVLAGRVDEGRRLAVEARDLARERGQRELADAIERELAKLPQ